MQKNNSEFEPHSRLFVVSCKSLTEEEFREAFSEFGPIEEIWCVKDRNTGEFKGVTYIQYTKTLHAAKAMEALNNKPIGASGRPAKVMVASSREEGSKRDLKETDKLLRLFLKVPRSMTDSELYHAFKEFGNIDYATIIRDKNTNVSKGIAYVKFYKFVDAANAYENCDQSMKPVFAEPKKNMANEDAHFGNNFDSYERRGGGGSLLPPPPLSLFKSDSAGSFTRLSVMGPPMLSQEKLWRLFDLIPDLDFCEIEMDHDYGRLIGTVIYKSPEWAQYALDKLHGFEYPPGHRILVRAEYDGPSRPSRVRRPPSLPVTNRKSLAAEPQGQSSNQILELAEMIAKASGILQAAGINPSILGSSVKAEDDVRCSVDLPPKQPLAKPNAQLAARCFIVCMPAGLPPKVLSNLFSRFGDLMEVYLLPHKNCGYVLYASKESARDAIETLHGAEVNEVRLKVMEAEEKPEESRKRARTDD